MTTAKTEEALISALVEGDERGVEELLGRYWAPAYRVAYQLTGDPGSAEDVAQEAFIRALRAIGRFDTAQPFRPWFFQILKNEARKHHRARARREGHEARAEAASRPSRDHDAVEAVHTYLAQLPEDQREPIALHYLGGFTLHEVGELLGCPKSTVNTRIRRGMDALRLRLQPTCAIAPAALIELLRSGPAAAAPPAAIELVAAARLSALAIPTPPASAELASAARRGGSWWLGGLLAAPLLAVTVVALLVSDPPSPEAVGAAPAWPSSSVAALASSVPDPEAPPEPPPSDASTPSDTSTPLEISTPPTFPQQGDPAPVLEEAMLHPDYERLKLYRTYARLDGASPYQHRFTAWFHAVEWNMLEVGALDLGDMQGLGPERLQASWGGGCFPPEEISPVPEAVQPLAAALEARLRQVYPELQQLHVRYDGECRTFSLTELIPIDPERAVWGVSMGTLGQRRGESEVFPVGGMLVGGTGLIMDPAARPVWIDYLYPPELEGGSLLNAVFGCQDTTEAERRAFDDLCDATRRAADAWLGGQGHDTLTDLLHAQGPGRLPEGFASRCVLLLTVYGRADPLRVEQVALEFSLQDARADVSECEATAVEGLLRLEGRLSLRPDTEEGGALTVTVRGPDGVAHTLRAVLPLAASQLILDGERIAIGGRLGGLNLVFGESEVPAAARVFDLPEGLTLPGAGSYTGFTISPEQQLTTTVRPRPTSERDD